MDMCKTVNVNHASNLKVALKMISAVPPDLHIVSKEGFQILAHRSILSLISPYLSQIFSDIPGWIKPSILLPDVSANTINKFLKIIYASISTVSDVDDIFEEEVDSIFNVAKLLGTEAQFRAGIKSDDDKREFLDNKVEVSKHGYNTKFYIDDKTGNDFDNSDENMMHYKMPNTDFELDVSMESGTYSEKQIKQINVSNRGDVEDHTSEKLPGIVNMEHTYPSLEQLKLNCMESVVTSQENDELDNSNKSKVNRKRPLSNEEDIDGDIETSLFYKRQRTFSFFQDRISKPGDQNSIQNFRASKELVDSIVEDMIKDSIKSGITDDVDKELDTELENVSQCYNEIQNEVNKEMSTSTNYLDLNDERPEIDINEHQSEKNQFKINMTPETDHHEQEIEFDTYDLSDKDDAKNSESDFENDEESNLTTLTTYTKTKLIEFPQPVSLHMLEYDYNLIYILGDGHCLFRSLAHGLGYTPEMNMHLQVRQQIALEGFRRILFYYKLSNYYLDEPNSLSAFEAYLKNILYGGATWGGNIDLAIASKLYEMDIYKLCYSSATDSTYYSVFSANDGELRAERFVILHFDDSRKGKEHYSALEKIGGNVRPVLQVTDSVQSWVEMPDGTGKWSRFGGNFQVFETADEVTLEILDDSDSEAEEDENEEVKFEAEVSKNGSEEESDVWEDEDFYDESQSNNGELITRPNVIDEDLGRTEVTFIKKESYGSFDNFNEEGKNDSYMIDDERKESDVFNEGDKDGNIQEVHNHIELDSFIVAEITNNKNKNNKIDSGYTHDIYSGKLDDNINIEIRDNDDIINELKESDFKIEQNGERNFETGEVNGFIEDEDFELIRPMETIEDYQQDMDDINEDMKSSQGLIVENEKENTKKENITDYNTNIFLTEVKKEHDESRIIVWNNKDPILPSNEDNYDLIDEDEDDNADNSTVEVIVNTFSNHELNTEKMCEEPENLLENKEDCRERELYNTVSSFDLTIDTNDIISDEINGNITNNWNNANISRNSFDLTEDDGDLKADSNAAVIGMKTDKIVNNFVQIEEGLLEDKSDWNEEIDESGETSFDLTLDEDYTKTRENIHEEIEDFIDDEHYEKRSNKMAKRYEKCFDLTLDEFTNKTKIDDMNTDGVKLLELHQNSNSVTEIVVDDFEAGDLSISDDAIYDNDESGCMDEEFIGPKINLSVDTFEKLVHVFISTPNMSTHMVENVSESLGTSVKDVRWAFLKLKHKFQMKNRFPGEDCSALLELVQTVKDAKLLNNMLTF